MYGPTVESRDFPAPPGEEFVARRIVDDTDLPDSLSGHRDRYRKMGVAMREIRGSVNRINHPDPFGIGERNLGCRAFLAEHGVRWMSDRNSMGDQRFRSPVDLGDQVDSTLVQSLPVPANAITEQAAGIVGKPYRGLVNRTNLISGFQTSPLASERVSRQYIEVESRNHPSRWIAQNAAAPIMAALSVQYVNLGLIKRGLAEWPATASSSEARKREFAATPPARMTVLAPCNVAASTVFLVRTATIASWNPAAKSATGNPVRKVGGTCVANDSLAFGVWLAGEVAVRLDTRSRAVFRPEKAEVEELLSHARGNGMSAGYPIRRQTELPARPDIPDQAASRLCRMPRRPHRRVWCPSNVYSPGAALDQVCMATGDDQGQTAGNTISP